MQPPNEHRSRPGDRQATTSRRRRGYWNRVDAYLDPASDDTDEEWLNELLAALGYQPAQQRSGPATTRTTRFCTARRGGRWR